MAPISHIKNQQFVNNLSTLKACFYRKSLTISYICVLDKKIHLALNLYERRNQKEQLFSR